VERWVALPLFASQAALPEETRARQREHRLASTARGLAGSLRGMGTGVMPPLWDRLPELDVPTLLLAGALDDKFCAIARSMAGLLPDARLEIVPSSGHAVHLERPDAVMDAILGS
jgi:pimeloyl-ACP methyl ester carboxylesterase